jgi:stage V sporulation protein G
MTSPDTTLRIGADLVITDIRVTPQHDRALLAFATITLNDVFVVHGLKIIDGAKGRFVAMPSRARRDGKHQDIAHPITRPWRDYMEDQVLEAYEEAVGDSRRDGDS